MKTHTWNNKNIGDMGETILDKHFSKWFNIEEVSREEQRLGIDRIFTKKDIPVKFSVEYKTDLMAGKTNNVFIETMSVEEKNKLGWAYTSLAQYIMYFVPTTSIYFVISVVEMKHCLAGWKTNYVEKRLRNVMGKTVYHSSGLIIPIKDFKTFFYSYSIGVE